MIPIAGPTLPESNLTRTAPLGRSDELWNVIVVVPAHDEHERIAACTASVLRSLDAIAKQLLQAVFVIVADNCADDTATIARHTIDSPRRHCRGSSRACVSSYVVEVGNGNVGTARAIGVAFGQQALGPVDRTRTWVANTDADTTVPPTWIADQLRWADQGVAAVAGVVTVDTFDDHPPMVAERFHATYTALLPDDTLDHEHVHGANLGVRLDSYLHAGGWQQLELSEDHDLWNRMRTKGLPLRSPSSIRVVTSGRAISRCPGGFADALCAHRSNKNHQP